MSFLVVSHRHELIPFAYRLKNQGEKTELVVCTPRFEKAWEGKFDRILPAKEVSRTNLEPTLELARAGQVTVLSNNHKTSKMFNEVDSFYGTCEVEEYPKPSSLLRVGGWWEGGELHNPHLLIYDLGAWPGGYGPNVPGGMTLIRVEPSQVPLLLEAIEPLTTLLQEKYWFQGLLQASLKESLLGQLEIEGVELGWPFLQSHAFLSELESFSSLLLKEPVELPQKVVTVVPVSLHPWPVEFEWNGPDRQPRLRSPESLPIGGLSSKQISQVFWHDVQLDIEQRTIKTGGLDGLLGIARGAAHTPHLARKRAMTLALSMTVPEKQVRPDAAGAVSEALAQLEERLGVVL